jgi:hypothetical protein
MQTGRRGLNASLTRNLSAEGKRCIPALEEPTPHFSREGRLDEVSLMTTPKEKRDQRLAAALRENLKRRKAQAKDRSAAGDADDDHRVSTPRGDQPDQAASHAGASTQHTSRT